MNEENSSNKAEASPYVDIQNPFGVGSAGAEAEYLLKNPKEMPELGVGAKTIVEDTRDGKDIWFAAQVKELRAISPFQPERQKKLYLQDDEKDPTALFSQVDGPHTHEPMIINLQLDQELEIEDKCEENITYRRSAVQRPPSINSRMHFPELRNDTADEPSLSDILQIKDNGIPLGAVGFGNRPLDKNGEYLVYRWDLDNLDIKHTFIVGESGSGKTVLLKRMGLHIRDQLDATVIFTDVQGDIIQLAFDDIAEEPVRSGWQEDLADQLNGLPEIEQMEPFKIVVPRSHGDRHDYVTSIRAVAQDDPSLRYREIGLRLKDIEDIGQVEYLFTTDSDYASNIINDAIEGLENFDSDITIENLRDYLEQRVNPTEREVTINDTNYYMSSLQAVVSGAIDDLDRYFDNDPNTLGMDQNPLEELYEEDETIILYLDHLNKKERLMYEMQMIRWLYENRSRDWSPYVFIDEAHQVIPAKPPFKTGSRTFDRLESTFERLAREGRKYDVNLILSTQSPTDINDIVNDQCHTRIVMKIDEDSAKVADLNQQELQRIADRFGKGQMFIKSPFNDTSEWLRLHSWLPNLPHEDMEFYDELEDVAINI